MIILLLLYWVAVIVLFFAGLITIIASKTPEGRKHGIKLLIISVIMLVIGGAACGIMLSGLGGMH
jgi:type III secretory pathway component EscS